MTNPLLPKYPIYIPSKGRADHCTTARVLLRDGVPFFLVVESQEADLYAAQFGQDCLLVLPFQNHGLISARNWIKDHATASGAERHWQIDDNTASGFFRVSRGMRYRCAAGPALAIPEIFVDRYENIAIAGLQYDFFLPDNRQFHPPFLLNHHVYSCTLVLNRIPHRWRSTYNDDTDLCLQVLADGWCTVLFQAFLFNKRRTMRVKGGNTDALYGGDGRLKMARALERLWPGVVTTYRRFQRPQHHVAHHWAKFDTPLQLKSGIDLSALPAVDNFDLTLTQVRSIRSPELQAMYANEQKYN